MSIHEKLAERLREWGDSQDCAPRHGDECEGMRRTTAHRIACDVEAGRYADILGVDEPTIEDVEREAERKLGAGSLVYEKPKLGVRVLPPKGTVPKVTAPTLASAYAALRALPSKEGT